MVKILSKSAKEKIMKIPIEERLKNLEDAFASGNISDVVNIAFEYCDVVKTANKLGLLMQHQIDHYNAEYKQIIKVDRLSSF